MWLLRRMCMLRTLANFSRDNGRKRLVLLQGCDSDGPHRVSARIVADWHVPSACRVLSWYSRLLYTWKSIVGYTEPVRYRLLL